MSRTATFLKGRFLPQEDYVVEDKKYSLALLTFLSFPFWGRFYLFLSWCQDRPTPKGKKSEAPCRVFEFRKKSTGPVPKKDNGKKGGPTRIRFQCKKAQSPDYDTACDRIDPIHSQRNGLT